MAKYEMIVAHLYSILSDFLGNSALMLVIEI